MTHCANGTDNANFPQHKNIRNCCGGTNREMPEATSGPCPAQGYFSPIEEEDSSYSTVWVLLVLLFVIVILVGLIVRRNRRRRRDRDQEEELERADAQPLVVSSSTTTHNQLDMSQPTSGKGAPDTVERTIAREVRLVKIIGRGRFGKVWVGVWNGRQVACKVFDSRDDASWERETKAFKIEGIAHKYILHLIAADRRESGVELEYWLITDYHANGSLYEHLKRTKLTKEQSLTLQHTVIDGVNHLHTHIQGAAGKLQVAHRDIKTKNILVNNHGESIIADLGLAVSYDPTRDQIDLPRLDDFATTNGIQVGTKRYMPPEILQYDDLKEDNVFNKRDFKSFLAADTYALGLVLWEIASRTQTTDGAEVGEYRVPFEAEAPSDPTLEEMVQIVCIDEVRPQLEGQPEISKLIKECLHARPQARINTLRLRKKLDFLT